MAQRSFKTDESFLEKLAIGAIGTQKVIEDLTNQGHTPVELERGSAGYRASGTPFTFTDLKL